MVGNFGVEESRRQSIEEEGNQCLLGLDLVLHRVDKLAAERVAEF